MHTQVHPREIFARVARKQLRSDQRDGVHLIKVNYAASADGRSSTRTFHPPSEKDS